MGWWSRLRRGWGLAWRWGWGRDRRRGHFWLLFSFQKLNTLGPGLADQWSFLSPLVRLVLCWSHRCRLAAGCRLVLYSASSCYGYRDRQSQRSHRERLLFWTFCPDALASAPRMIHEWSGLGAAWPFRRRAHSQSLLLCLSWLTDGAAVRHYNLKRKIV